MLSREEREREQEQRRAGWVPERELLAMEEAWSPITILSPDGPRQPQLNVDVRELRRQRFGVADYVPISYRSGTGKGIFVVTDKRRVRL